MRGVRGRENVSVAENQPKELRKKICKIDGMIFKPYVGKDDLPREKLDSKGNIVEPGESRYFVARGEECYKLMRMYRAKGIKRSLVRVLKIKKMDERGAKDREILKQLKEAEIPGAI